MIAKSIVAAILAAALAVPVGAQAKTVDQISDALISLVQPYNDHPVVTDPAYRMEIARAIYDAARSSGVPSLFLAALFFRESSFRKAVVEGRRQGSRHERGLGQVNGVAHWWCTQKGYDLHTIAGQAMCSAGWLARCRASCDGTLEQGLAFYSTGRSCKPSYAGKVVKDRIDLWQRLEREAAAKGGK
jgi:hypothetical protein